jgi:glycosyltransferase involved in cell wall biosynthesis
MLILLDCRPLQYAGSGSEKAHFIFSAAAALSGERGVKWLFVVDHSYQPEMLPDLAGVSILTHASILTRRAFPGRAGWRLWYDWQIPRLARHHKADLLMLTAGIAAADPAVPQCLWMPERANPAEGDTGKRHPSIYAGRLVASLQRAAAVFCFSQRDRVWLAGRYPAGEEKTFVLQTVPAEGVSPSAATEKEKIKAGYVQGKEYFLADLTGAGEEDTMNLLKAFSLFKKRQLSNMQLVLTGRASVSASGVKEKLKTYKYRQDVHWPDELPEKEERGLRGAAYAALFPVDGNTLGTPLLNAWAAGVPAIVINGGLLQEMAGGSALGATAGDPAALAAQLMLIYKDESLRRDLIAEGLDRLGAFSRERTLDRVWGGIRRATGKVSV